MSHLVNNRLMFGNMLLVDSEVWVERYNKALNHLTGRRTNLTEFHIDISGFSPEVAEELGNNDYLNPKHAHRQFIILSSQQASSPMLRGEFSFLRDGVKEFIKQNEAAIITATAYDVLIGEIDDAAWMIRDASDLSKIRSVKISARAMSEQAVDSSKMAGLADRFMNEERGWLDHDLIAEMIVLSGKGGGLLKNPVVINDFIFKTDSFYSNMFGGVYIIREGDAKYAIFRDEKRVTEIPGHDVISIDDEREVFNAFSENRWLGHIAIFEKEALPSLCRKMDYLSIGLICSHAEESPQGLSTGDLNAERSRRGLGMTDKMREISLVIRCIEHDDPVDNVNIRNAAWPLLTYGKTEHSNMEVNAVLAEISGDLAILFALNKNAFYQRFSSMSECEQASFARRIADDYLSCKKSFRSKNHI